MNMHERIMAGKLFTDMCEGMPQERDEAKKRMIAFNATTPDTLEERLRIQKEMLHPSSGEAWIEPPFYFCYGRHIINLMNRSLPFMRLHRDRKYQIIHQKKGAIGERKQKKETLEIK